MAQHITVVEPSPQWEELFAQEAKKIQDILKENCVAVHHIGSTAVPNLAAKPIIDIMPVVKSLALVDEVAPQFQAIGYEDLGEFGIAGRRYLRKGGDERTHQIHIFQENDELNITRHLAFRDYLRAHPDVKEAYATLKRSWLCSSPTILTAIATERRTS